MSTSRLPVWWEPAAIAGVLIGLGMPIVDLPGEMDTGQFLLLVAVVFFAQSLIRDLIIMARTAGSVRSDQGSARVAQVFCLESGIGVAIVVIGTVVLLAGLGGTVTLSRPQWLLTLTVVLVANYLLRDFVFSWNPWRIYRDTDHINIVPRLRTPKGPR